MRTIGLLGGMSWESTETYYRVINETVARALGGLHSARCLISSVDFAEIEPLQSAGEWGELARILTEEARSLARAGADFLVICTNTIHKLAPEIERGAGIPLLHIASAAADELRRAGVRRAGVLGTRFTLHERFYTDVLRAGGVEPLLPDEAEIPELDRIIFDELCRGEVLPESREKYLKAIEGFAARGAGAVLLGCTELGLLLDGAEAALPLFDSAVIHARRAAELALEG